MPQLNVRIICAVLALTAPHAGASKEIPGIPLVVTLITVDDGDSFSAYDANGQRHRIRLAAIDAPERAQPHGQISGRHLTKLLSDKPISVFRRKKDRYQRWIAKVVVDGANVGLQQVKAGNAWHFKRFAQEQPANEREAFRQAELVAREARIGLWKAADPLAPWQWRRNKRNKR